MKIQTDMFDTAYELDVLSQYGGGALSSFTGIARKDGNVNAIELEHYPAMTQAALENLAAHAMERWQLLGCTIIHRVGHIHVGEAIVLIGTASLHRRSAIEACSFLIDRLKTDAPFWKKEHYDDGTSKWVEQKESDTTSASKWAD